MELFRKAAEKLNEKGYSEWAAGNYTFSCIVSTAIVCVLKHA